MGPMGGLHTGLHTIWTCGLTMPRAACSLQRWAAPEARRLLAQVFASLAAGPDSSAELVMGLEQAQGCVRRAALQAAAAASQLVWPPPAAPGSTLTTFPSAPSRASTAAPSRAVHVKGQGSTQPRGPTSGQDSVSVKGALCCCREGHVPWSRCVAFLQQAGLVPAAPLGKATSGAQEGLSLASALAQLLSGGTSAAPTYPSAAAAGQVLSQAEQQQLLPLSFSRFVEVLLCVAAGCAGGSSSPLDEGQLDAVLRRVAQWRSRVLSSAPQHAPGSASSQTERSTSHRSSALGATGGTQAATTAAALQQAAPHPAAGAAQELPCAHTMAFLYSCYSRLALDGSCFAPGMAEAVAAAVDCKLLNAGRIPMSEQQAAAVVAAVLEEGGGGRSGSSGGGSGSGVRMLNPEQWQAALCSLAAAALPPATKPAAARKLLMHGYLAPLQRKWRTRCGGGGCATGAIERWRLRTTVRRCQGACLVAAFFAASACW